MRVRLQFCLPSTSFRKLLFQPLGVAAVGSDKVKNTLYVADLTTGSRFLVDSGAEVSVFPLSKAILDNRYTFNINDPPRLMAANGSPIKTFGTTEIILNLGKRCFKHQFLVADVTRPILSADFFLPSMAC